MADGCSANGGAAPRAAFDSGVAPGVVSCVTLSIVSHGNGEEILLVLEDLARQEPHPERIRVLVTMNVPEAPCWVHRQWPFLVTTICNPHPKGYAANHNEAFRRCETPYFGVMNPDLRVPQPVVTEICDRLAITRAAMAAPIMTDRAGARADNARPLITPLEIAQRFVKRKLGRSYVIRNGDNRYDWVAGMFMMFDRQAFETLGGFDPHFYLYCEDFDICARLRLAGLDFDVYEDLRVVHGARRRSHRDVRFFVWHVSSLTRIWTSTTFWHYRRMLRTEPQRPAESGGALPLYPNGEQHVEFAGPLHAAAQTLSAADLPDSAPGVGAEHPIS
ncbi:MAG: glycosyltransferase [Burkholderiaceae bacterium]|nr:glycosyltransferase [Burkholderiaceae bacterium]